MQQYGNGFKIPQPIIGNDYDPVAEAEGILASVREPVLV